MSDDEKKPPRYTLLTEKDVARLIRMSVFKLQRDRSRGIGLPYLVVGGRSIRYRDIDVWAWIEAHIRKPR